MTTPLRKLLLTAHVTFSVGWLGAVAAYLALAIAGLTSRDAQTVRAAYLSMELIGWGVIVPLGGLTVLTGLVQSLVTEWGLFRHYWIAAKLGLTLVAVVVLLVHMKTAVSPMARIAAAAELGPGDHAQHRVQLVLHAAGGLAVLLTTTALSVWKPWGLTPWGKKKQAERRGVVEARPDFVAVPVLVAAGGRSVEWWAKVVGAHVVVLALLAVVVLHVSGGMSNH